MATEELLKAAYYEATLEPKTREGESAAVAIWLYKLHKVLVEEEERALQDEKLLLCKKHDFNMFKVKRHNKETYAFCLVPTKKLKKSADLSKPMCHMECAQQHILHSLRICLSCRLKNGPIIQPVQRICEVGRELDKILRWLADSLLLFQAPWVDSDGKRRYLDMPVDVRKPWAEIFMGEVRTLYGDRWEGKSDGVWRQMLKTVFGERWSDGVDLDNDFIKAWISGEAYDPYDDCDCPYLAGASKLEREDECEVVDFEDYCEFQGRPPCRRPEAPFQLRPHPSLLLLSLSEDQNSVLDKRLP
jgi:hypothetical protein